MIIENDKTKRTLLCDECGQEIDGKAIIHEHWQKGEEPRITYASHEKCYIETLKK